MPSSVDPRSTDIWGDRSQVSKEPRSFTLDTLAAESEASAIASTDSSSRIGMAPARTSGSRRWNIDQRRFEVLKNGVWEAETK
jgi:hypothetical protein